MFSLTFYGNDGEFEYTIQRSEFPEYLFRHPRVHGFSWDFDGDGWYTTLDKRFPEANQVGGFLIIRD